MFRNKEFKLTIIIIILVTLAGTTLMAFKPAYAIDVFIMTQIINIILFITINTYRYIKIKKISQNIVKYQNGQSTLDFSEYTEGELSLLSSEIRKLMEKMTEQKDALKKDKNYLAGALSDISHQLKTPLTSMMIMVDLLSDGELPEEKREEFVNAIITQLKRIEWLVAMLLKMSRFDAGTVKMNRVKTNLEQTINKSIEHLLIPMEIKNISYNIKNLGNNTECFIDVKWTCEALSNIVKNCIEHTPEAGSINIEYDINSLYTKIIIRDTGVGIDKEDLPNIFDRFYKGKNSDKDSVGIGLAFAKQIVNLQNGVIQAKSEIGVGTEFTIKLYKKG